MSSVLPLPTDQTGLKADQSESTSTTHSLIGYRPDIDGLRGIAVLSVLAVHSFPLWIKGGFIGVDIFFVLSGFLITGILLQSLEAKRFSYIDFYARRTRRIFPALCLVLFACLVFSALYTFPAQARTIGKHVGAGALFISNFMLWQESGYFDLSSEAKPLLHLWSLGIEEQFYIFWPMAMVVLFRFKRWAVWVLCVALLASFVCNLAFVVTKPSATFFLPPTRFWELMMGALLAYLTRYHDGGPVAWLRRRVPAASWAHRRMADGFATVGLLMLMTALALIDKGVYFPGWWALLPTFGTFALLAAGPGAWVNYHVLSQSILRFYGTISYPLYLWHWPLLSFPVVMGIALTNEVRVMILIGSVVLASLTYELLEKPIRSNRTGPRTLLLLCAALGLVGLGGLVMKQTDGLLNTVPQSVRTIAATEFRFDYSDYRVDKCMTRLHQGPEIFSEDCIDRRDSSRRLVFLWGDSHAASLYPGLAKLMADHQPGYRLAQYTASDCPPLLATPASDNKHCARTNKFTLERLAAEKPDTVVLGAHWARYGTEPAMVSAHMASLRDTVRHLKTLGVRRVVVFGHLPTWSIPQPTLLMKQWRSTGAVPERTNDYLKLSSLSYDKVIEHAVDGTGAVFVSPIGQMCNSAGCQVSMSDKGIFHSISSDDSHLTAQGSEILVQRSAATIFN